MYFRGLFVLLTVFIVVMNTKAQEYPFWFLYQGSVNCRTSAAGYSEKSPRQDSMISYALANAAVNCAAYRFVTIKGEQTYWGTEAGKYRMSASSEEIIGENEVNEARGILKVVDFFENNGCMIVLGADSICSISVSLKERMNLSQMKSPIWTEEIPRALGFIYAVGLAPHYYYQSSSWIEAERIARRNLARALNAEIKGIQKSSREGQSLEQLTSDVILQNVEVVERWLDVHDKLYYVLVRCKVN